MSKAKVKSEKAKIVEFDSKLYRNEFIRNQIKSAKSHNSERYFAKVYEMTDQQVIDDMEGTAIWDDPPKGWTKRDLVKYSRGYLVGRGTEAFNLMQRFEFIESMLDKKTADPYQKNELKHVVDLIFQVLKDGIKEDKKAIKWLEKVQKSAYSFYKIK